MPDSGFDPLATDWRPGVARVGVVATGAVVVAGFAGAFFGWTKVWIALAGLLSILALARVSPRWIPEAADGPRLRALRRATFGLTLLWCLSGVSFIWGSMQEMDLHVLRLTATLTGASFTASLAGAAMEAAVTIGSHHDLRERRGGVIELALVSLLAIFVCPIIVLVLLVGRLGFDPPAERPPSEGSGEVSVLESGFRGPPTQEDEAQG